MQSRPRRGLSYASFRSFLILFEVFLRLGGSLNRRGNACEAFTSRRPAEFPSKAFQSSRRATLCDAKATRKRRRPPKREKERMSNEFDFDLEKRHRATEHFRSPKPQKASPYLTPVRAKLGFGFFISTSTLLPPTLILLYIILSLYLLLI